MRLITAGDSMVEHLKVGMLIADPALNAQLVGALASHPARVVMEAPDVGTLRAALIEREVRRCGPDAVFLEMAAAGERAADLIEAIRRGPSPPLVITIHAKAESGGLLSAFRAGANDCLCLPLEEAVVRQVLDRVAAERERRRPRQPLAKTVGFLSATGGCGATTVACHLASELSRGSGQNVLLADFDLIAGMLNFWMGSANGYSVWDAMRAWQTLDVSMWRGLVWTVPPQLDVLGAPSEVVADQACDLEHLQKVLRFARSLYDWVIADLGSSLTASSLRLLGELNVLCLVSTAEVPVLFQSKRLLGKLQALGYPRCRVRLVLNRLRKRQQIMSAEVEQALGWPVDAGLPDASLEIEEAQAKGRLVSPRSQFGKSITQLATRLTSERIEEPEGFPIRGLGPAQAVRALRKAL